MNTYNPADASVQIYCQNTNEYISVPGGSSLLDIYNIVKDAIPFEPVNGRVNNKAEELNFRVYAPKTVEFMPVTSDSGYRTYIRSLCMMLYHAVNTLLPGCNIRIAHSLSRGYYCLIEGTGQKPDEVLAGKLEAHIRSLVERDLPFVRRELRTADVIDIFKKQGLKYKALLLETTHEPYSAFYELDGLCDSYYGALVPRTGQLGVFRIVPYEEGLLLLGPDRQNPAVPATPVEQKKMYKAFTSYQAFNSIVGVKTVGEMNRAVEKGESPMLINVAEALHNNRIATIADDITERFERGDARIVLVAGPSSSGKTTFTKRLAIQLMTNLITPVMISLDDYFLDRHKTPLDETGDYDYESLYALDLELFNEHLNALLRGEEVEIPYYNFESGSREFRGNKIRLAPDSILLIEGIHGLNPELTAGVDARMKYRVYVSALTSIAIDYHNWIPTTDNRLLRRMVRDARYRGVAPAETIRRWASVRRGEEKWIFPYQENADAMFNSSLLFELGVMRHRAEPLLARVPHDIPEYSEAARLHRFLSYFTPISEEYIPSTSLIREFLGGSSFKY